MEVRSVEAIVRALNDAGVRYLVVGGLAVNAHGYERLTKDIDLVLSLDTQNLKTGLDALLGIGYRLSIPVSIDDVTDPRLRKSWRDDKNMIVLKMWSDDHRRTPVDIFIEEPFDFEAEYGQADWFSVSSALLMPVVRLATLLEMKKTAGRPQDLADIEDLLTVDRLRREGPDLSGM